jgi:nitrate/nitrite-specific signal transduction histidine kinase
MPLRKRLNGLGARIIAWSFVPTAIILAAVAVVTFYAYQQVVQDLVIERNQELARLSAGQLSTEVLTHANLLSSVARSLTTEMGKGTELPVALASEANRLVIFDGGVVALNPRGLVMGATEQAKYPLGGDWSADPVYRTVVRSSSPVYSDILDAPASGAVVQVAVQVTGDHNELLGVLVGMFRLDAGEVSAFFGGILRQRIAESGTFTIVDGTGKIIYSSAGDSEGEDLSGRAAVRQVLSAGVGSLRSTDSHGSRIVQSFAPIPNTHWGLIMEDDWASLMRPAQRYQNVLLLLLALGILVPSIVVMLGVRRITRPLQEMIQGAQEVAGGDFSRTLRIPESEEMGALARQFNTMSERLQESYAQLEKRVTDRTRQLEVLNGVSAVVSQSLDVAPIMEAALRKTLEFTGMGAGGAFQLEPAQGERPASLQLVAMAGVAPEHMALVTGIRMPADDAEQALAGQNPVCKDVATYPEGTVRSVLERIGVGMVIIVPLVSKGRLLGALKIGEAKYRSVAEDESALLMAIGQQVGVAVENARLFEKVEEAAAMAERSRLARDLHDAVTQTLFSASLIAEVLPKIFARNVDEGYRRLEELRQLTRGALAEMRTLLLELRPSALIDAPLADLLRQLGESITGRARLPVRVKVEGDYELPPEVKVALYRIVQEALNNVAKHAGANEVSVHVTNQASGVTLEIRDDGIGFDPAEIPPDHLGLGIMRERAADIGAQLDIRSSRGGGTCVSACWMPAGG